MSERKRRRINAGLILIAVGLGLYLMDRFEGIGGEAILLIIGSAFLVAYFVQRQYGFLVPACILLGLGFGNLGEHSFLSFGDAALLGLSFGFAAIFLIARIYQGRSHWWPLIPAGVLFLVAFPRTHDLFEYAFDHWQLVLVLVGVLILVGAFRRGER